MKGSFHAFFQGDKLKTLSNGIPRITAIQLSALWSRCRIQWRSYAISNCSLVNFIIGNIQEFRLNL